MSDPYQVVLSSPRLSKMYQDPKFQQFSLADQQKVKDRYFREIVMADPKFQALSDLSKMEVYQKIMRTPPAFENGYFYSDVRSAAQTGTASSAMTDFIYKMGTPFMRGTVIGSGLAKVMDAADYVMKQTGVMNQAAPNMSAITWGKDAEKLSQWILAKDGKAGVGPMIATIAGNIFDYVALAGVIKWIATGVGPIRQIKGAVDTYRAGKAAAQTYKAANLVAGMTKAQVKTINTLAASVGRQAGAMAELASLPSKYLQWRGVLGLSGRAVKWVEAAAAGNKAAQVGVSLSRPAAWMATRLAMGARAGGLSRYAVESVLPSVIRAVGTGGMFAAQQDALKLLGGEQLSFKETAKNFGLGFAGDALLNTIMASIVPFLKLTSKAVFGRGITVGSLKSAEVMTPETYRGFVRDVKLGIMANETFDLVDPSIRDHINANVQYDRFRIGGFGALKDNVEEVTKAWGFHMGLDVVPGTEGGKFRLREWPGYLTRSEGGEIKQMGGRLLGENLSLAETTSILARRYTTNKEFLQVHIAQREKDLARYEAKLKTLEKGSPDALEKELEILSAKQDIIGSKMTLEGLISGPGSTLDPLATTISRSAETFDVAKQEGRITPSKRSTLTYDEAEAAIASDVSNSIKTQIFVEPGRLSGKNATIEGTHARARVKKSQKVAFVAQDAPFRVSPAPASGYNAVAVFGKFLHEGAGWKQMLKEAGELKARNPEMKVSIEEIAQQKALAEGFDAVKMEDGSYLLLAPRSQLKHVSELYNPKTGKYMRGPDKPKAGTVSKPHPGMSPAAARDLGKGIVIKQSLHLNVPYEALADEEKAAIEMLTHVSYGYLDPDLIRKASMLILEKAHQNPVKVAIRVDSDITAKDTKVQISAEAAKKYKYEKGHPEGFVVTIPDKIVTAEDQRIFLETLGSQLHQLRRAEMVRPTAEAIERFYKERTDIQQISRFQPRMKPDKYAEEGTPGPGTARLENVVSVRPVKTVTQKPEGLKTVKSDAFGEVDEFAAQIEGGPLEVGFEEKPLGSAVQFTGKEVIIDRLKTPEGVVFTVTKGATVGAEEKGRFNSLMEARRRAAELIGEDGEILEVWRGKSPIQPRWREEGIPMPRDARAAAAWVIASGDNVLTRITRARPKALEQQKRIRAKEKKGKGFYGNRLVVEAEFSDALNSRVSTLSTSGKILKLMGEEVSSRAQLDELLNQVRASTQAAGFREPLKNGYVITADGSQIGAAPTRAEADAIVKAFQDQVAANFSGKAVVPKPEIIVTFHHENELVNSLKETVANIPASTEMTTATRELMRSALDGDVGGVVAQLEEIDRLGSKPKPANAPADIPPEPRQIPKGTAEEKSLEVAPNPEEASYSRRLPPPEKEAMSAQELIRAYKPQLDKLMEMEGELDPLQISAYVEQMLGEKMNVTVKRVDGLPTKLIRFIEGPEPAKGQPKELILVVPRSIPEPIRIYRYRGDVKRTWILRAVPRVSQGSLRENDVVIRKVETGDEGVVYVLHKGVKGVHEKLPGVRGKMKNLVKAEAEAREYVKKTGGRIYKSWSEPGRFSDEATVVDEIAAEAPEEAYIPPKIPEPPSPLPDWIKEGLIAKGRKIGAMLNLVDIGNPGMRELLAADPLVKWLEKTNPKLAAEAKEGNITVAEYRAAKAEMSRRLGPGDKGYIVWKGDKPVTVDEKGNPRPVTLAAAKKIAEEASFDGKVYVENKSDIPATKYPEVSTEDVLKLRAQRESQKGAEKKAGAARKKVEYLLSDASDFDIAHEPQNLYAVLDQKKKVIREDIPDLDTAMTLAVDNAYTGEKKEVLKLIRQYEDEGKLSKAMAERKRKEVGKPQVDILRTWEDGEVSKQTRAFTNAVGLRVANLKRKDLAYAKEAYESAIEESIVAFPGLTPEAAKVKRKQLFRAPLPDANTEEKIKWLEDALEKNKDTTGLKYVAQDTYELSFANGYVSKLRGSLDEVIDQYLVWHTDFPVVRNELMAQGFDVSRDKAGFIKVWVAGERVKGREPDFTAKDVPQLLEQMNWRPSRISASFAPEEILIGTTGMDFKIRGRYVTANMDEATELLNKFYDPEQEAVKQIVKRTPMGMVTKFIGEEYWVEIPRLGLREHFDSIREAHEFLVNKKFQELLYLDRLSSERGYIFRIRNGQYSLVSEGGTFYAKDLEGALDILGRKADPSFAPNLFKGISEMDIEQFKAKKMTSYVADFWTTPNLTDITQPEMAGGAMSRQFTPMANWIETVARKYGFHKLAELYREADANYAIAMGQANKFRQVLIRELSEPEMGPMMNWGLSSKPKKLGLYPEEIRRGMLMWLEQVDDEGRNFVAKEMKLEERHIKSAKNIRELLGTSGVNGLAAKFGIPPERFLFGYLPRIRESAAKLGYGPGNPMKLDDSQLDQLILHAGVPSDLKFWAENERLSDLVNFAREGDLLRLLLTYSEQGHKKMFLNPVWKKIDDYVKNVPVGKIIRGAMDEYREMVMGTFTTRAEQRMKQFGRGVAARLGFKNPEVGTKLMDTIYTLTTLTTQAFRPFLTVRNMLQLYTTGHVLTDVRFVEKAMQEVAYDPLKAIQLGAELGYVKEAPPMLNEIQRGEGQGPAWLLGELTEKGMRGVQRSDALSRVVVYRAAGHQFDHAAKLFGKKAPMSLAAEEAFGLDLVARDVAAQAKALMGKGDAQSWNTARHLVSENLQRLTMFDYGKPNAPAAFHGLLGKAFGHLMVFPAYYAALVKHVFTHGSPARKIKTVAKLAGIATATYAGLELMGLDGKTFLPWVPMTMTGGPIVNLAIEALWSMDTTSYRGRQARGELQGMLTRTLVPGSYEYRMVSNFLKYMDEGKPWLAFLAISSAPIRTDLR